MILSFFDEDTASLAAGERVSRLADCQPAARLLLRQLDISERLEDLRLPPDNRLEALAGFRAGQHGIRIDDRHRLCFRWTVAGAEEVEIVEMGEQPQGDRPMDRLAPVSPGELLRDAFLGPLGITKYRLAKELGVPHPRIGQIVNGKRGITADTDLRLCRFFGLSKGYWLRAQAAYEAELAEGELAEELARIVPWAERGAEGSERFLK